MWYQLMMKWTDRHIFALQQRVKMNLMNQEKQMHEFLKPLKWYYQIELVRSKRLLY